jgi:glycosyltransferase involved in cell wall biosynthesis
MTIDLIFITHNRLEYTKLSLASVLADETEEFSLTIWDNASTDATVDYLKNQVNDARIADIVFSKENIGQIAAVNQVWARSKADLVGKLDNDCIVTPGWTRTLTEAHNDIPKLGVVACWHFFPDDFIYELAQQKIQQFNRHRILRHPWTCGTGFLLKRDTFSKLGPMEGNVTTPYWLKVALAGYVNGFYYPFIYQEHMDDPRSSHTMLKSDGDLIKLMPETARKFHVITLDEWVRFLRRDALVIHTQSTDPRDHNGWRPRLRKIKNKIGL